MIRGQDRDHKFKHYQQKGCKHRAHAITLAMWNVRTLVENAGGGRRICRLRPGLCFGVAVAGIQETKWFGGDVWTADGYTLLHSGRPLPEENDPQVRNESVGILLNQDATRAWKDAGESWEAISSRLVMARLKVARAGQRRPGCARETSNTYVSVVSAYAPTAKAPSGVKAKFTR